MSSHMITTKLGRGADVAAAIGKASSRAAIAA